MPGPERLTTEYLGHLEQNLRKVFLEKAFVIDHEKGYIDVSSVNKIITWEFQEAASEYVAGLINFQRVKHDLVVGIPNSGLALAAVCALKLKKNLHMARKYDVPGSWRDPLVVSDVWSFTTDKATEMYFMNGLEHGMSGLRVLIVDDFMATGTSAIRVAKSFRRAGANITFITAVAKLFQPGVENFKKSVGVDPIYLIGVEALRENGEIVLAPQQF